MTEIEAIENLNKLVEIWEDDENMYSDTMKIEIDQEFMDCIYRSIDALKEVQKYHDIGTVEECRDAMEKQMPKDPEHFYKKYGKHKWKRKESGEIDEFAFEADRHNGVVCEICGETVCIHCNPDYDKLDDCEEEYWICPNCNKKIYWESKYCQCGQHLKWGDSD